MIGWMLIAALAIWFVYLPSGICVASKAAFATFVFGTMGGYIGMAL